MAQHNPLLIVEHLTKSFGDKLLFDDVSFSIAEGQRVALIARNGIGKTTLLRMLAGEEDHDAGKITFRSDTRVAFLPQKPLLPPEKSVGEICSDKALLDRLSIRQLDQKIGTLSGGQLKRVALANVLTLQPDLLILDEPTNHLDLPMVEWLETYLSRTRMALLMVTHDRYFLDRVCSDIIELDQQQLFTYHGNYSYYLEKRAERIAVFNAETERARNLYRTELEWMRRMPQARGHKSKDRIDAFYTLEDRAHQSIREDSVQLQNRAVYIGSKIFEAKQVSKAYGETVIMRHFDYVFARHEKLGITGNNGTGKTTFLRLLLGLEQPDSGVFDIGETVRFGYFAQTGFPVVPGQKVIDVIRAVAEEIDLGGGKRLTASQFLQHFLFSPSEQYDFVEKLSGGELQRLNLCRVLMQNPNFLILDEPTNDLDIPTMNILEDYLRGFGGCLIVVSHDRYFMDKVVDHLLVFHGAGEIQDFPGNYTQYRSSSSSTSSSGPSSSSRVSSSSNSSSSSSAGRTTAARPRRLSFKEQQELRQLEVQLPLLEQEKADLEEQLSGQLSDADAIQRASLRYEEVKNLLDEAEMRWLELSEIA